MVNRRYRAVVEVRRGGPEAVQRRGLVAGRGQRFVAAYEPAVFLLGKPAPVVIAAELRADAVVTPPVGADLVNFYHAVGIGPIRAVSAVALRASLLEHDIPLRCLVAVDGERVFRWLQAQQVSLNIAEDRLGTVEVGRRVERAHHELHDRAHRPGVGAAGLVHGLFFLEQPPGGRVFAHVVVQTQLDALDAQRQVRLAVAQQEHGHRAGFAGAADIGESERHLAAAAAGQVHLLKQRMNVERAVAQADVALPHDRAAVADQAIDA